MIYIIPQGKAIFTINPRNPEEINKYSFSINPVMFSASFTYSGKLLIGTQENLLYVIWKKILSQLPALLKDSIIQMLTAIRQTQDSTSIRHRH